MRPAPLEYLRPASLAAALPALAAGATPLAGGQSLLPALRLRELAPASLLDLRDIAELDARIDVDADRIRIGALATHRDVLEHAGLGAAMPWLHEAARALGDVQVRNVGTVAGNVCWADPRANFAVALLASDAVVVAVGADGESRLPISRFFTGFRLQTLGPRLATAIEIERHPDTRGTYREFSRQRQDLALVNITVVKRPDCVRIAVGGIDPTPVRLADVEEVAVRGGPNALAAALESELTPLRHQPLVDQHGTAAFKLELAATLIRRALVPKGQPA